MTKEELIAFEEDIKNLFLEGKIHAPIHLSRGNEEPLIEIFKEVEPEDFCFSTHRSHYHALLKGVDPEWLKAEILVGRSMHIYSKEHRFFTSSLVGGCLPIAMGVAMTIKRKGGENKVWVFTGDMASMTGVFHECIRYAHNFCLPINFIIEDNGLSTNTPTREVWGMNPLTPSAPVGKVRTRIEWHDKGMVVGKILYYRYERGFPHINCGKFIVFR